MPKKHKKRIIKFKTVLIKHETGHMSARAVELWETCKTKREAYTLGYNNGRSMSQRESSEDIISLKKEILALKSAREGERTQIKSRLIEHIGNATNDLSRLMKEI